MHRFNRLAICIIFIHINNARSDYILINIIFLVTFDWNKMLWIFYKYLIFLYTKTTHQFVYLQQNYKVISIYQLVTSTARLSLLLWSHVVYTGRKHFIRLSWCGSPWDNECLHSQWIWWLSVLDFTNTFYYL